MYDFFMFLHNLKSTKISGWTWFFGFIGILFIWLTYDTIAYRVSVVKKDLGCIEFGVSKTKELNITRAQKQGGNYTRYVYVLTQNQYGIKQINYELGAILPVVKNNTISVELQHTYIGQTGESIYTPVTTSDNCHP